jgi:protein-S-isoprenylcysteine O-methyltransferase Ste14
MDSGCISIMKIGVQAGATGLVGLAVFGLLLFLPAQTFDYWQAWAFIAVFALATAIPSAYLGLTNPAALQRRMRAGPAEETRPVQRLLAAGAFFAFGALMVVSAFDHRFGWSQVPAAISVLGDVLVAVGLGLAMLVVIQNGYAAATIAVETGQTLTTTGLYAVVRHPMYVGALIMMVGIPLALGSWWGLVTLIPGLVLLVLRIRDEERMLEEALDGYSEYTHKVHYRLVPRVW